MASLTGTPASCTNVDACGLYTPAWGSPGNAAAQDGSYATTSLTVYPYGNSDYLTCKTYGLNLPGNVQAITGIRVSVRCYASGSASPNGRIWMLKAGAAAGTQKNMGAWPGSAGDITLGGDGDLWGTTWTPADIEDAGFGARLQAYNGVEGSNTFQVDLVEVTVYYTVPTHTVQVAAAIASAAQVNTPTVLPYRNLAATADGLSTAQADLELLAAWGEDAVSCQAAGTSSMGAELYVPEYVDLSVAAACSSLVSFDAIQFVSVDAAAGGAFQLGASLTVDSSVLLDMTAACTGGMTAAAQLPQPPVFPTVAVEVAFVDLLADLELEWTDITRRVRSVSIRRGKPNELADTDPGSCVLDVDNRDRALDPANTQSPYWPLVLPRRPIRITATYLGVPYVIFAGYVSRWPRRRDQPRAARVALEAVDGLALLAGKHVGADGDWPKELTGQRATRVADLASWPAHARSIQLGQSYVAPRTTPADEEPQTEPALDHLRQVAHTERGAVYASRDGALVFHDRAHHLAAPTVAVFGEAAGEISYTRLETDDTEPANEIIVTRQGGRAQTATDAESVARYLIPATLSVQNLMTADVCSLSLAQALLERYRDPRPRITGMAVDPRPDPAAWQALLGLDLDDLIMIRDRGLGTGPTVEQTSIVEGVQHDFDTRPARRWATTIQVSPLFTPTTQVLPDGVDVPINESPPVIVGTPQVGLQVKVKAGTGLGRWYDRTQEEMTPSYRWLRCEYTDGPDPDDPDQTIRTITTRVPIPGATGDTYTCAPDDLHRILICQVTAGNSAGQTAADSNALGPVELEYTGGDDEGPGWDDGTGDGTDGGDEGSDPTAHDFILDVDELDDPLALLT